MEITKEALLKHGFTVHGYGKHEYFCFPQPLGGHYRLSYSDVLKEWKIVHTTGYSELTLKHPTTMQGVRNFYTGICDQVNFIN